jgi:hypothetical protein
MSTPKITRVTQYKDTIITPAPKRGGFDVITPEGQWFNVQTQKQAKWWGSVHTRLQREFASNTIIAVPVPREDHTPKEKS